MTDDTSDEQRLSDQPVPEGVRCPECGAPPLYTPDEALEVEHRLSAAGYLHDDISLRCSEPECDTSWTHGVPIGEFQGGDDLWCGACNRTHRLVHRVEIKPPFEAATLHLKCPECYHFGTVERRLDEGNVALVGYPAITGDTEGAHPYGWLESDPPEPRSDAEETAVTARNRAEADDEDANE